MQTHLWCHNFVFLGFGEVVAPGMVASTRGGEGKTSTGRRAVPQYMWCHNFVFPVFGEVVAPGGGVQARVGLPLAGARNAKRGKIQDPNVTKLARGRGALRGDTWCLAPP